jgi:hypothetical protein
VPDYNVTQLVTNSTSSSITTYVYSAQLDDATSVSQAYTFFDLATTSVFAGTNFSVRAGALKWSINLTISADEAAATSPGANGLTLRYLLSNLLFNSSSGTAPSSSEWRKITTKANTPKLEMTTYIVQLDESAVVEVELFDVAFIDGQLTLINHSIVLIETAGADNGTAEWSYALELHFPAFNQSVYYDPSLGLGVLLTGSSKSGDSSDNTALIIATAVAIPVAVVLVLAVIIAALLVAWRRRRTGPNALELDHVLEEEGHSTSDHDL